MPGAPGSGASWPPGVRQQLEYATYKSIRQEQLADWAAGKGTSYLDLCNLITSDMVSKDKPAPPNPRENLDLKIRQTSTNSDESQGSSIPTGTKIGIAVWFPIAGLLITLLLCLYMRERRLRKSLEWRPAEEPSRISSFYSRISFKSVPTSSPTKRGSVPSGDSRHPGTGGSGVIKSTNAPTIASEKRGWRPTAHTSTNIQPSHPAAVEIG